MKNLLFFRSVLIFFFFNLCVFFNTASEAGIKKDTYLIQYPKEVNHLFKLINPQLMWEQLNILTSFRDRSVVHESGKQASYWIKDQLKLYSQMANRQDVEIRLVKTEGTWPGTEIQFKQPSIILKIGHSNLPGIVIGAHIDTMASCGESVSCKNFKDTRSIPGADDDGSGLVTVMELSRVLLESHIHFKKPIYLIFYAGEEAGYAGSKIIVNNFITQKIPIEAVMQLDMTGFACKNDLTMWLHLDKYTNKPLTIYLQKLIQAYIKRPAKITTRGEGGSDEMIWGEAGFKTVKPQDTVDAFDKECGTPFIHSADDSIDKLSLIHMTDYLKLAVAFVVEMATPTHS